MRLLPSRGSHIYSSLFFPRIRIPTALPALPVNLLRAQIQSPAGLRPPIGCRTLAKCLPFAIILHAFISFLKISLLLYEITARLDTALPDAIADTLVLQTAPASFYSTTLSCRKFLKMPLVRMARASDATPENRTTAYSNPSQSSNRTP